MEEESTDSNGCSILHWAAFMDRKLLTQMMFRLGFDFSKKDDMEMTPWDRALDNWSLFVINFILDYSDRPLKTNYFINGHTNWTYLQLLPEKPKKRLYEIESNYIPYKMVEIMKRRRGSFDSLVRLCQESLALDIVHMVKYNWDRYNIPYKYWIKVYLGIFFSMLFHCFLLTPSATAFLTRVIFGVITLTLACRFGKFSSILLIFCCFLLHLVF